MKAISTVSFIAMVFCIGISAGAVQAGQLKIVNNRAKQIPFHVETTNRCIPEGYYDVTVNSKANTVVNYSSSCKCVDVSMKDTTPPMGCGIQCYKGDKLTLIVEDCNDGAANDCFGNFRVKWFAE